MTKKSGWQLSGSAPEAYEHYWIPALMGPCARALVAAGGVRPGDRVLDVGCGTGVVAREAAADAGPTGRVVGSDLNEPMLGFASRFAEAAGLREIDWQQCDAAAMPFDDGSFDVTLCQQGLQFMPDRAAVLAEMARVLAPGGRLAVSVWQTASQLGTALCAALDARFGEGTTAPWQVAYSLGDRDELRDLATAAGFRAAHVRLDVFLARHPDPQDFVLGIIAASPMAGQVADMSDAEQAALAGDALARIPSALDDGGLAAPAACHTLTALR